MSERYLGLISGTSADGIDAVLVDFAARPPRIESAGTVAFDPDLAHYLQSLLAAPNHVSAWTLAELDAQLGDAFAAAATHYLREAAADSVAGIGCHGQTIVHAPNGNPPFSLQLGDPNRVAAATSVPVIADFRRMDIAVGGEGAPLAPLIHRQLWHDDSEDRAVVNIGGIANVSWLPADPAAPVAGFDTGPGNCLMDEWIRRQRGAACDRGGAWSRRGRVHPELLAALLTDPFFARKPPKSTGRETIGLGWVHRHYPDYDSLPAADVQATLLELTARTIADGIRSLGQPGSVWLCGGGTHNTALTERLSELLRTVPVRSTAETGFNPDHIEGLLFAWLARQRLHHRPVDTTRITGARHPVLLGAVYAAS